MNISTTLSTRQEALLYYENLLELSKKKHCFHSVVAQLGRKDLFFLLSIILGRKDIQKNDWLYLRCKEVEHSPNEHLDLWAREHYKSTIITFGKSIQDILNNPEITIGIFSHTRPMAKDFLNQIKYEFESNEFLQSLYPDVLWKNPKKEAPIWSLDKGIIVKRFHNPKEATVEAWGLTDGQPIGKHFHLLLYDDIVTKDGVSSPEMIHKVTESWALSLNLGTRTGIRRYIGTRYHHNDTWSTLLERNIVTPRIYPATVDGNFDSDGVLFSKEELAHKKRAMGSYIFSCQMLQSPIADSIQCFNPHWLKFYTTIEDTHLQAMNIYILVDPAGEKKKNSDYSVFLVIALGEDKNYYLIDCVRERLSLTQKSKVLFALHKKYQPITVGYEKYGMQADIEYIYTEQDKYNYRFSITPLGGTLSKKERISQLMPLFEEGKMYIPQHIITIDNDGKKRDFIQEFIQEEYSTYPVSKHDDMLDCFARIVDPTLNAIFPNQNIFTVQESITEYSVYD
ncbi:MAG: hypothetical protein ACRCV3_01810 [Desulfovibrionaceae bacterium]